MTDWTRQPAAKARTMDRRNARRAKLASGRVFLLLAFGPTVEDRQPVEAR